MRELLQLFLIFLKIGATSFGGNVALVAAVRKELCEKRKLISDNELLDYMTLGNLLPGPLATNVITTCGYTIRGIPGALVCLFAVLLPAFVLLCIISELYIRYGEVPAVEKLFAGLLAGVAAVIAATAWSLAKKNVRSPFQIAVLVAAGAAVLFFKGFLTTLLIIVVAGALGFFFSKKNTAANVQQSVSSNRKNSWAPLLAFGSLLLVGVVLFLLHPAASPFRELRLLGLSFGSMSLTLFGGGYVFIPAIQKVVVDTHHWVTLREFADAIAISQVTPGPISISAAFVGWKVAGLGGAAIATLGIFLPPALLMTVAQQFMSRIKNPPVVEAVFAGVRPAVIGMIAASVWVIGSSAPIDWQSIVIFTAILVLVLWKNWDTAVLIPLAGALGWALHLL